MCSPRDYDRKAKISKAKKVTAIYNLEEFLAFVLRTVAADNGFNESSLTETDLFSLLNEDRMRSLYSLLNEQMSQINVSPAVTRHIEIELPVFRYVSGRVSPTLKNRMHTERFLIIESSSYSHNQRVVASHSFYRQENGKNDTAVVNSGEAASF